MDVLSARHDDGPHASGQNLRTTVWLVVSHRGSDACRIAHRLPDGFLSRLSRAAFYFSIFWRRRE